MTTPKKQQIKLSDLLRDSAYKLTQFKSAQIQALEASITMKDTGKNPTPYVTCLVRGKPIKLTPEEAVRQLFVMVLKDDMGYPVNRMELEYGVVFGREKKQNTILFSKDGSVGEAYCLRENANFITSGAVLHLTVLDPDHVLPEYLTLALNSKLVKMQAERDAGGSIILHWRVGEIENVVVPLVDMPTQEKIAAMVQESFSLKAESERLLDVAKRAVEIAIEQGGNVALDWLLKMAPAKAIQPNG